MASVASERIPIATLHPSLPAPATKSITALVTILWPYSSSTRTCALLLAEPDFRLRRRRGQVRVQFFGDAAYAVATSQLGIGDKVVLKLGGAQWLQPSGEDEVVRTPGKSVDWELGFRDRLAMLVTRDGKQFANIDVERSTPEQSEDEPEEEAVYNTPSKIVGRFSAEGLRFNTWSSPAFLKHGRLSREPISDYDLLAEDDEPKSRKRRRTSFKNVSVWTYAARTPSPEKEDPISGEDAPASPSERLAAPTLAAQVLELPQTPVSARMTPAEVPADKEDDFIPDHPENKGIQAPRAYSPGHGTVPGALEEEAKDYDDALYKQYLEEVHEDQGGDTEIDDYSNEPEDEPVAPFSIRDAELVQEDGGPESLPSVLPDADVAVPSAAASVRVDESPDESEQNSTTEELRLVEMTSTEADSEIEASGLSQSEEQGAPANEKPESAHVRLSSEGEDEREYGRDPSVSSQFQDVRDERRAISDGAPGELFLAPGDDGAKQDLHKKSEPSARRTNDDADPKEIETQKMPFMSMSVESSPQKADSATSPFSSVTVVPSMPPPVLPQVPMQGVTPRSPERTPPMGPVNAPSTPQLQPVTSTTLPLPSPFPGAAGASSYMDARPTAPQQASLSNAAGQVQHDIRPATAISVAQAAHEASRSAQHPHSHESMIGPALGMVGPASTISVDKSQHGNPSTAFQYEPEESAPSTMQVPHSIGVKKVPGVDVQDTQLDEPASSPAASKTAERNRFDETAPVEETTDISQALPSVVQPSGNERSQLLGLSAHATQERFTARESQAPLLPSSKDVGHGSDEQRSAQISEKSALVSDTIEAERPTLDNTHPTDVSAESRDVPVSDDTYLPVFQDDDWDMHDAEVEAVSTSTPKAIVSQEEAERVEVTPTASSQTQPLATTISTAMQRPPSSAVEIVDLGSESVGKEAEETNGAATVAEASPKLIPKGGIGRRSPSPALSTIHQDIAQTVEKAVKKEQLRSSPPVSPPRTRRRTRQSTMETVSYAEISTPTRRRTRQSTVDTLSQADTAISGRSQRRSLRSSQASRPLQGISGVAARVAQRRRRIEVKDSECEWDSNASISTQRPSSPSAPSDGPPQLLEPLAVPEPSQILGDLSQMAPQTQQEKVQRPSASPITPTASSVTPDLPLAVDQVSENNPQEFQNRRLQRKLEGAAIEDLSAERSSSPFPELDFEWGKKKPKVDAGAEAQAQPEQSSFLKDEFNKAEPTHSSMLQDDSNVLRAIRTSQFPFGTQRQRQPTPSVESDGQQTAHAESLPPSVADTASSFGKMDVAPHRKDFEESQLPLITTSFLERAEESQLAGVETSDAQHSSLREQATIIHPSLSIKSDASESSKSSTASKAVVTSVPQTLPESNVLTPEASQEIPEVQLTAQDNQVESAFPPTPRQTQTTSVAASFSEVEAHPAESQTLQKSIDEQSQTADDDTDMEEETSQVEPTALEASQKSGAARRIKWTPSQLSQGTRTSYSYFTPLAHLTSYTNSQSLTVDVLAVCTAPNKAPIRATAGPRDYTTLFSITDMSLENGAEVRVQVFRPWKAALPECDVGDAVLLRGFEVKSRKGKPRLISGGESAWCVFRYGAIQKWKSAGVSQEATDAEGEDRDKAGKKGHAKRTSDIMESMKPIWADVMSGLWGAVGSQEQAEGSDGEAAAVDTHQNVVSGATREEVHGPPVEFGDEERREAKGLREWWVGVGGKKGSGKEVKPERARGKAGTYQKRKHDDREGKKSEEAKEEKVENTVKKGFFKSFLE
ncbi:hypothetical protein B0J12DRAFT_657461 [Macrophomina phaseolina]|uniref:Telomeric single stranded DNA binding POT1/Cdc13 domain-containing protein n=1 Tax=Macrophomina phaseolina TaxID=35725 RepID=A0ABQ8GFI0_9PEZI|nr:hypothetical protein B0J12DRAFT_657461 [Macrophomina phaseolina]